MTDFQTGLGKTAANYQPLTPLSFIARTAAVWPERTAIVHGNRRYTWRDTYQRCRRLAAALAAHGIGANDTVAVMAPNIPEMIEAHFGVAMAGGVLNAINTRLDAATIAYILRHGEAKILLTDTEFAPVISAALAELGAAAPLVIDIADPEGPGGPTLGALDYEAFLAGGDPDFEGQMPEDEWSAISLNYTSGTTGKPKGVVYHHRGAYLNALGNAVTWSLAHHPVYLWTLPMFHCNGWCFPWTITALAGTHVCLRRVDAAFEPLPRVGSQAEAAAGEGDAHRIEQGALEEDSACGGIRTGGLAAHDAGKRLHPFGIGDGAVFRAEGVVLAIQGAEGFAPAAAKGEGGARDLVHVEHMQRAAKVDSEEVGDIDERIDRAQANGEQPALQPLWAWPVAQIAHGAAQHPGAVFRPLHRPAHRAWGGRPHFRDHEGFEGAEAGGGEVAGHAADGEGIAAIGGDGDLDHRVVKPGPVGVGHAERGVGRELDDAGVVVADPHFARRKKHAVACHAADAARFQGETSAGNKGAGGGEHRLHAAAGVGRAANHRDKSTLAAIDHTGVQAIGVRVLRCLHHPGDAEGGEGGGAVFHPFHFEADGGEGGGDRVQRGVGFEMRLEPGEGELHRPTSPRAGWRG